MRALILMFLCSLAACAPPSEPEVEEREVAAIPDLPSQSELAQAREVVMRYFTLLRSQEAKSAMLWCEPEEANAFARRLDRYADDYNTNIAEPLQPSREGRPLPQATVSLQLLRGTDNLMDGEADLSWRGGEWCIAAIGLQPPPVPLPA